MPDTSDKDLLSFDWVKSHASAFKLSGNKIEVINEPSEFHNRIKALARTSKRRILLASLYLGTGPLERELVSCIEEALQNSEDKDTNLKVVVILDHMRGSRGAVNSRTTLMPLIKKFSKSQFPSQASLSSSSPSQTSMQLFLYHSPDLKGWLKQILPERFDEVVGLFHIKAYVFDDSVVISGANLSQSYFSDRQDRYIVIKDFKPLADFYDSLLTTVSKYSFLVCPDNTMHYTHQDHHPYLGNVSNDEFRKKLKEDVEELINPKETPANKNEGDDDFDTPNNKFDTLIYPLVQMGPMGVDQDRVVTELILKRLSQNYRVCLASGYFNLTHEYMDIIINQSKASFDIVTAAPQANSFFESPGISKYIPVAYTHIASSFVGDINNACQEDRIKMYEYNRPNWTVHAKGVWLYPPRSVNGPDLPFMTMIGSPNYGYRSVKRDLETQVVIVTKNESLQRQLHEEKENIYKNSVQVTDATFKTPERRVPLWVSWVTPYIKNFF